MWHGFRMEYQDVAWFAHGISRCGMVFAWNIYQDVAWFAHGISRCRMVCAWNIKM